MQVVILSGPGWHTDELSRALSEHGHVSRVLPYEALVAQLGGQAARLACGTTSILDADAVLARFVPSGSLEQIIFRIDARRIDDGHSAVFNPMQRVDAKDD